MGARCSHRRSKLRTRSWWHEVARRDVRRHCSPSAVSGPLPASLLPVPGAVPFTALPSVRSGALPVSGGGPLFVLEVRGPSSLGALASCSDSSKTRSDQFPRGRTIGFRSWARIRRRIGIVVEVGNERHGSYGAMLRSKQLHAREKSLIALHMSCLSIHKLHSASGSSAIFARDLSADCGGNVLLDEKALRNRTHTFHRCESKSVHPLQLEKVLARQIRAKAADILWGRVPAEFMGRN